MRMRPSLTADDAKTMMAACINEAEKQQWSLSIAIVDDAGYILRLDRMDGAGPASSDVALGKARTAAITRRRTREWEERLKDRPAFLTYPADVMLQGGVPIFHEGECVGAIGVSGRASHEDEQVADAGVAALS